MDVDIKQEFYIQNEKILRDKLILDLDNNKDTLFKALENFYRQRFIEAKASIIDIYEFAGAELEENTLSDILQKYGMFLKDKSKEIINSRFESLKKEIKDVTLNEFTIDGYINKVKQIIIDYDKDFYKGIEEFINSNEISNLVSMLEKNDSDFAVANERTYNLLKESIPKSIVKKTTDYLKDRSGAISNNAMESFKRMKITNDKIINN